MHPIINTVLFITLKICEVQSCFKVVSLMRVLLDMNLGVGIFILSDLFANYRLLSSCNLMSLKNVVGTKLEQ